MNPIDLGALVLLAIAVTLGFRSGALPQVGGLVGAGVGAVGGLSLLSSLADPLSGLSPIARAVAVLGGLLILVITGETIGATLGRLAASRVPAGLPKAADRVAGAIVGAAQGLLIVWLAGWLLAAGAIPSLTAAAQSSATLRALEAVPPPTALAGRVARLIDAAGLPDLFVGLDPVPADPVALPSDAVAAAIAAGAAASTFRVVAETCDLRSSGSSALVAPAYVVTNAHVVAGARSIEVDGPSGPLPAVAVLFDPRLDVAVLHVRGLPGVPLRFTTSDPGRGTVGATIGFPGGGAQVVAPAAVTTTLDAVGLDVSGLHQVTRHVIELRGTVRKGDSGGPLVITGGTIGGLVFAESRVDPNVGYALSPVDVSVAVAPAIGRTGAADLGSCHP